MDVFFNVCKIKYDILDEYIGKSISRNNIHTCNLFINLDYINYRFRNVQSNTRFQACGASAFKQYASNVLNLVAHYKKWFNRNGLSVKCYIYYTDAAGGFTSALIKRGYREDYLIKQDMNNPDCYYVNSATTAGIQLLKTMCDYIDGVYMINTKGEEPSVVPYLVAMNKPADWNYLLSMDRLELQYCNYDKFSILYPSIKFGSKVVNSSELWEIIGAKENLFRPHLSQYDPRLFIPAMAIAGDRTRSIKKVKALGWGAIFDALEEIYNMDSEHSIITSLEHMEELLSTKNKATTEKYLYTYRMNTLVISMKSRYDVMSESNKAMILAQIRDIPDKETVNQIANNPMILGNYPINVDALFGISTNRVDWSKKY